MHNIACTTPLPQLRLDEVTQEPVSYKSLVWRKFRRHRLALVGMVLLVIFEIGRASCRERVYTVV